MRMRKYQCNDRISIFALCMPYHYVCGYIHVYVHRYVGVCMYIYRCGVCMHIQLFQKRLSYSQ